MKINRKSWHARLYFATEFESHNTMRINSCDYIRVVVSNLFALCIALTFVFVLSYSTGAFFSALVREMIVGVMPWIAWTDILFMQVPTWVSTDGAVAIGVAVATTSVGLAAFALIIQVINYTVRRWNDWLSSKPEPEDNHTFTDVVKTRWVDKVCVELDVPPIKYEE
jgi:hypothetical protein